MLNGFAGISADMALRLRDALGTSAEMWVNLQSNYDLWQAEQRPRPKVMSFREPAHACTSGSRPGQPQPVGHQRPSPGMRWLSASKAAEGCWWLTAPRD
ncbi:MAG: HigA family addiction module antidote protein [Alcaligenaceae bacterium]|nr:HigA family addiction module antidote protein [Alcaligenaceae bacterium]